MPYTRRSASEWTDHIHAYRESKESAERYAKRHGLSISTLRAWIAKLKTPTTAPRLVPLVMRPLPTPEPPPPLDPPSPVLEVSQLRIHVMPGFDPALLSEVIRTLSRELG